MKKLLILIFSAVLAFGASAQVKKMDKPIYKNRDRAPMYAPPSKHWGAYKKSLGVKADTATVEGLKSYKRKRGLK